MEHVEMPIRYDTMVNLAATFGLDESFVDAWCYRFVDTSGETQVKAQTFWDTCILPLIA